MGHTEITEIAERLRTGTLTGTGTIFLCYPCFNFFDPTVMPLETFLCFLCFNFVDPLVMLLEEFLRSLRFNFVDPLVMLLEEFLRSLRFLRDLDLHSRFTRGSARPFKRRLCVTFKSTAKVLKKSIRIGNLRKNCSCLTFVYVDF